MTWTRADHTRAALCQRLSGIVIDGRRWALASGATPTPPTSRPSPPWLSVSHCAASLALAWLSPLGRAMVGRRVLPEAPAHPLTPSQAGRPPQMTTACFNGRHGKATMLRLRTRKRTKRIAITTASDRKERGDSHDSQSGSSKRDLCNARRRARRLCADPFLPRLLRWRLSLRNQRLLLR